MSDLSRYFGQGGPFAETCELYSQRFKRLPADILRFAVALGAPCRAYLLGYCFAQTLHRRKMMITGDDLAEIAKNKITSAVPLEFVNGFRRFQADNSEETPR
jgi:hypothetical protein